MNPNWNDLKKIQDAFADTSQRVMREQGHHLPHLFLWTRADVPWALKKIGEPLGLYLQASKYDEYWAINTPAPPTSRDSATAVCKLLGREDQLERFEGAARYLAEMVQDENRAWDMVWQKWLANSNMQEKHLIAQVWRELAKRLKAFAALTIMEGWCVKRPLDAYVETVVASKDPERFEVLSLCLEAKDRQRVLIIPVERANPKDDESLLLGFGKPEASEEEHPYAGAMSILGEDPKERV